MIKPGRLCSNCNGFIRRTCVGYDYWPIKDIRYCKLQMMYLIEHRDLIRTGSYPPDPYVSGYVGGGFSGVKARAPFESVLQEAGELDSRIDLTREMNMRLDASGLAGKLLIAEIDAGRTIKELSSEAYTILVFISGWRRKSMRLTDWVKQYRFRHDLTTKSIHR